MRPFLILFICYFVMMGQTQAAPPFLSANPELLKEGKGMLYFYSTLTKLGAPIRAANLHGPAFRGDFGVVQDVQLSLIVPMATHIPTPSRPHHKRHSSLGDMAIITAYSFLHETDNCPQAAFAPLFIFPTGNARHATGNGKLITQLPVWFQKTWGSWRSIFGGGYTIDPAPNKRNHVFGGPALKYVLPQNFTVGMELIYYTKMHINTSDYLLMNVGAIYYFAKNWRIFGSMGHTVTGTQQLLQIWDLVGNGKIEERTFS
jgi:hypothetical protein